MKALSYVTYPWNEGMTQVDKSFVPVNSWVSHRWSKYSFLKIEIVAVFRKSVERAEGISIL